MSDAHDAAARAAPGKSSTRSNHIHANSAAEGKVSNAAAPPNACAGKFVKLPVPQFDPVTTRAH